MFLSKLVYLSVKDVIQLDDPSFNYDEFKKGTATGSADYGTSLMNAFMPINKAIARLSDLEKIPYCVDKVNFSVLESELVLSLDKLSRPVKSVVSIAQMKNGEYRRLNFRPFGINKVIISDWLNKNLPIYVEYKEDIKIFTEDDYAFKLDGDLIHIVTDRDEDLRNYGITDSMCNFICEYVKSSLLEQIEPSLANMHLTRAEQYFANIEGVASAFSHNNVEVLYTIED